MLKCLQFVILKIARWSPEGCRANLSSFGAIIWFLNLCVKKFTPEKHYVYIYKIGAISQLYIHT